MEVVLFSFRASRVFLALLVNSEKHSESLVINLETGCSVGQGLIAHREFSDTYTECRHSVFSSRE